VQSQDRFKTILVIVTGLLVLTWIFETSAPDGRSFFQRFITADIPLTIKICTLIGLASIFIPAVAGGIEWLWFKLALGLGWINSRILLSVIYFLVLLPIAWLSRLFTKDPLMLRRDKSTSMFVTRNHQYSKKDLENIW
jgi:hypothetical protein